MGSAIPNGWTWAKLGDICQESQYGWTTSAAKEGDLQILRTTDITSGIINWNTVPFCKENPIDIGKYLLKDGDIVISRAGSVGYSQLIKNPERSIFASYLIRFKPLINESYLSYFLKSPNYWKAISESSLGIALPNVNASKLKQILVPVPPAIEQHRIVARIDELFSRLDAGVEALRRAKAQLRRYRQSVLQAAVEGRLTAEWRAAHPEVEAAEELLERLRSNEMKKRRSDQELSDGLDFPKEWSWANLGEIGDVSGGLTKNSKRKNYTLKMPYLRVANVYAGELRLDEVKEIGVGENEIERVLLNPGDLLVVEGNGSPDQIGRVALWDGSISACVHQNHIIKVRFNPIRLGRFILYWLLSIKGREQISKVASSTSGLYTLSISKVAALSVPRPSLPEQEKIIEEIEYRTSVINEQNKILEESLLRQDRLRQSILQRAFQGKLVPQDSRDEPASLLLERIRAERIKEPQRRGRNSKIQARPAQ